jgi:DNA-binding response OmpR family regulator
MKKVLVADDDAHIRRLVREILTDAGFEAAEAVDGAEALVKIDGGGICLAVVDVMMPHTDGIALCRQLKKYDKEIPVLMLTARGEVRDKVQGFEAGADDYLVKPFAPEELVARIRALLKRYQIAASLTVQIGAVKLDKNSYTVESGGAAEDIPMKEFELLFLLASYAGKTLPRDRLIESVWGFDFEGNERTLDVHVNRLRERFPAESSGFRITAVRGIGYRLEAVK